MSKKHNLPDSLELLLDTMCNTFGGIMFIAISLIVISQQVTKSQQEMTDEAINKANMIKMEQNIKNLQQEIIALRQQELEQLLQSKDISPERKEIIKELLAVKDENLKIISDIERIDIKTAAEQERLKRLKDEEDELNTKLAEKKRQLKEKKAEIAETKRQILEQIAQLEKTLKNLQPKTLRFSREVATDLKPYWVLLKDNIIYRSGTDSNPRKDEVETLEIGNIVQLIPKHGTSLYDNPEKELDFLFRGIDKDYCFIRLVVDHHSLATLVVIKQYLRNKGFKVSWSVNPEFIFTLSNDVEYRASE